MHVCFKFMKMVDDSVKNTKPIAISSNLVKLLEKMIYNRIQDKLED